MKRYMGTFSSYLAASLVIFLLWFLAAEISGIPVIPSPLLALQKLGEIFFSAIALHGVYSLWRILAGLFLAMLIGIPLGIVMGYFPHFDEKFAPLLYLTYPVPKVALLPICMLILGLGESAKIFLIFLIVVFQVTVALRDSVRSIPQETYYPLCTLGAGFVDIFREVLWPASLPKFFTALRVAMGTAISVLFFTETFGTKYGLGFFIMDAWLRVNYLEMYAGIISLSLMGLLLFALIDGAEHFFCPWNHSG